MDTVLNDTVIEIKLELTNIEAEALENVFGWIEIDEYNGKADNLQDKIEKAIANAIVKKRVVHNFDI